MAKTRRSWFGFVREKFLRSSLPRETIIVLHTNNTSALNFTDEPSVTTTTSIAREDGLTGHHPDIQAPTPTTYIQKHEILDMEAEEVAATTIQAYYRRHLARRAYRALKSLVKLQAVVRGVYVRKQARLALECMHALAKLQITVRARQLLHTPRPL